MKKIGIACINHINALGYKNKLLYSIPNELKIFKEITSHTVSKNRPNIVVMGNNTFKSMRSKPLKDRFNCILSTNAEYLNKTNDDNNLKYYENFFNKAGSAFVLKPENLRFIPLTIKKPKKQNPKLSFAPRVYKKDYFTIKI